MLNLLIQVQEIKLNPISNNVLVGTGFHEKSMKKDQQQVSTRVMQ